MAQSYGLQDSVLLIVRDSRDKSQSPFKNREAERERTNVEVMVEEVEDGDVGGSVVVANKGPHL